MQLLVEVLVFSFALWLGLYLISRNLSDARLRYAGMGLLGYAVGLGLDILREHAAEPALATRLAEWQQFVLLIPGFFWLVLLIVVVRDSEPLALRLRRHPRPFAIFLAASLFFGLSLGFIYFPVLPVPRLLKILGLGVDLVLLGIAVVMLDAFDAGEILRPHFLRSLYYSFFTALLFGGQVALAMALATGVTPPMLVLLQTSIAAALFLQTFSNAFLSVFDRIAFSGYPLIRQKRAELHTAADAASRLNSYLDLAAIDSDEFARLTRRALSNLGNLPKLASSPLTQLNLVEARLGQTGNMAGTLERANELKSILSESIERLKPRDQGDFGTTDGWRYYNALYFPYVLGLKPYSRRFNSFSGDEVVKKAIDWFRTQVPQRTLYNWQNAAAQLVAQDIMEQEIAQPG